MLQGGGGGGRGPLPGPGAVAQRRVAAADAHRVDLAGAELLVAGGGDETRARRGTRLAVVDPCGGGQREEVFGAWCGG